MKRVFSAVYTRPARDPYLPQAGTNHENLAPIKGYTTSSIKGYTTSVHGQAARLPARSLALRDEGRDLEFAYWNSVFFVFVNTLPLSGTGRGQVQLDLPFFYLWTKILRNSSALILPFPTSTNVPMIDLTICFKKPLASISKRMRPSRPLFHSARITLRTAVRVGEPTDTK